MQPERFWFYSSFDFQVLTQNVYDFHWGSQENVPSGFTWFALTLPHISVTAAKRLPLFSLLGG